MPVMRRADGHGAGFPELWTSVTSEEWCAIRRELRKKRQASSNQGKRLVSIISRIESENKENAENKENT